MWQDWLPRKSGSYCSLSNDAGEGARATRAERTQ
jgi:hypothetical protein